MKNRTKKRAKPAPNPLLIDPSRTGLLRRQFVSVLRGQFQRLQNDIVDLIVAQDIFGLKGSPHDPFADAVKNMAENQPRDEYGRWMSTGGSSSPTFTSHEKKAIHSDTPTLTKQEAELKARQSYIYQYHGVTFNTAWSFASDPEKLKAFQQWLKARLDSYLRGKTEEELWKAYIMEGYRKGAGRAFDDTKAVQKAKAQGSQAELDYYAGTRDEFLRSSFAQPVSLEKVQLLASRSFDEMAGLTQDMATKLSRVLTDGLVQGQSPHAIARLIRDQIGLSRQRAETIARTEIIRAHAEGQLTALENLGVEEVGAAVEWSTTGDGKVCHLCKPLQGIVLKIEEARGMLPRHPNCVLPGNYIQGRIIAGLKSFYTGDAVEISTFANTARTTLTINHPVLTINGFVAAGKLKEGDYLVCHLGQTDGMVGADIENGPTLIEQVYDSFTTMLGKKSVASFDFDGDQEFMVGEVNMVAPNLPLTENVTRKFKSINDSLFMLSGNRSMSCASLSYSLLRSHLLPFKTLGFRLSTWCNAVFNKTRSYSVSINCKTIRQGLLRFSSNISRAEIRFINNQSMPNYCSFGSASELDTIFSQPTSDGVAFNPKFLTELLERFSGKVALRQVGDIRRFHYSGPVYDLESIPGYFTTSMGERESILIKNCRCAWTPAGVGEPSVGQKKTQAKIKKAVKLSAKLSQTKKQKESNVLTWGPAVPISKQRPESIFNHALMWNELREFSSLALTLNMAPNQPRDNKGRWSTTGGAALPTIPYKTVGTNLISLGSAGGSTGALLVKDTVTGHQYIQKAAKKHEREKADHLKNEELANNLYRTLGVRVPESHLVETGTRLVKLSEHLGKDSQTLAEWKMGKHPDAIEAMHHEISKNFVADALLSNWDVVGLGQDNVMIKDGKPFRIDSGGALRFRATGKPKKELFEDTVTELKSMRDPAINPNTAEVYGKLTDKEIHEQMVAVVAKRQKILKAAAGDPETQGKLAKRLDHLESLVKARTYNPKVKAAPKPTPPATPTPPVNQFAHLSKQPLVDAGAMIHKLDIGGHLLSKGFSLEKANDIVLLNPLGLKPHSYVAYPQHWSLTDQQELKKTFPNAMLAASMTIPATAHNVPSTFPKPTPTPVPAPKPTATPTAVPSSKVGITPTGTHDLTTAQGLVDFIYSHPDKGKHNSSDLYAEKIKFLNPNGLQNGTFIFPDIHESTQTKNIEQMEALKKVLPPGTKLKKKLVTKKHLEAHYAAQGASPPPTLKTKATKTSKTKSAAPASTPAGQHTGDKAFLNYLPEKNPGILSSVAPLQKGVEGPGVTDKGGQPPPIAYTTSPKQKMAEHKAWIATHSEEEKEHITDYSVGYTGNGYGKMREEVAAGYTTKRVKTLVNTLHNAPTYEGYVYRGMKAYSGSDGEKTMQAFIQAGVGATWTDPAMMSTSRSPKVAHQFSDGHVLLKIKSKSARILEDYSAHPGEAECLTMPGKQYRIVSITKNVPIEATGSTGSKLEFKQKLVVEMEEI